MNYYRRYIGDFQRDTGHLSLVEVGAYDRLLDHYYATEASLPITIETLCRIARAVTKEERDAVQEVADQFFPMVQRERRNKRADHEIAVSRKARDNGAKGGRPITGHETERLTENETGSITGQITGMQTGEGGGSGHPPTTNHQPPAFSLQEPATKRAARASRLPPDWEPSPEHVAFCKSERPDLDPIATGASFRDYWIAVPGARGLKLDWMATWRTWVRKEKLKPSSFRTSVADSNRAAADEATRRIRERG